MGRTPSGAPNLYNASGLSKGERADSSKGMENTVQAEFWHPTMVGITHGRIVMRLSGGGYVTIKYPHSWAIVLSESPETSSSCLRQ